MLPIGRVQKALTNQDEELLLKVRQGFAAEELNNKFGWIFEALEKEVQKQFRQVNPFDYQKFDNNPFLVLSLKMKVIEEMRSVILGAITDGEISEESLRNQEGGKK